MEKRFYDTKGPNKFCGNVLNPKCYVYWPLSKLKLTVTIIVHIWWVYWPNIKLKISLDWYDYDINLISYLNIKCFWWWNHLKIIKLPNCMYISTKNNNLISIMSRGTILRYLSRAFLGPKHEAVYHHLHIRLWSGEEKEDARRLYMVDHRADLQNVPYLHIFGYHNSSFLLFPQDIWRMRSKIYTKNRSP